MKAMQIASANLHRAVAAIPERPSILSTLYSQVRQPMGHGVQWRTGAAYLTLRDYTMVAVPKIRLKSALAQFGRNVLRVR